MSVPDDLPNFGDFRTCVRCNERKPINRFIPYIETSGTYFSKKCRECTGLQQRSKESNKLYMKTYHSDYQVRKKSHESARHKEYYLLNKDKIRQRVKKWTKTPQGIACIKTSNHRRRLRKKGSGRSFSSDQLEKLKAYTLNCCEYCGIQVGDQYHVDHIQPISRGGDGCIQNIAIACEHCNCSKNAKTLQEFDILLVAYFKIRNLHLFAS